MKSIFLTSAFLSIVLFGGFMHVFGQRDDSNAVIVDGNPPLTKATIVNTVVLLEWSLEIKLSDEEKGKIFQAMVGYWRSNNRAEIDSAVEISNLVNKLMNAGVEERKNAREALRNEIVSNLRKDTNDEISRMVLRVYEATHSPDNANLARTGDSTPPKKSGLRIGADGFSGIYIGIYNPPPGAAINSVQEAFVTFLPDGHVYWMLPPEGLLHFDARIAQRAYPDDWGTYRIVGREIHVTLGKGLRRIFIREGGKLKLQNYEGQYRAAESYTFSPLATGDGLRLNGTYRRWEGDPAITFAADGRFRDEGLTRNFGTIGRPDGSTYQGDGRGGAGTYLIEQNTLELRYADGRVKRFAFTALPEMLNRQPVQRFRLNYEILNLD